MSDPENFLTRWSRRKREADDAPDENDQSFSPAPPSAETAADPQRTSSAVAPVDAAAPAVDLSRLPSIESIAAGTDIRGFFAPGVPAELRLAALRRAWVADPQIRDFVGLADYDFDFNTPGAIPGFGPLEMTDDEVRRQVARIVGDLVPDPEAQQAAAAAAPPPVQPTAAIEETTDTPNSLPDSGNVESIDGEVPSVEQPPREVEAHRKEEFAALQQTIEPPENLQLPARRNHGGALPK